MIRIVATAAALLLFAAPSADAQDRATSRPDVAETAPLPPPRPSEIAREADVDGAPLPPPRPPVVEQGEAPQAAAPPRPTEPDPGPCLARLAQMGIHVDAVPALAEGECGAAHPFRMKALAGSVTLGADATVQCPLAEALGRWAGEAVAEEARRHLGSALKSVRVGTSYQCRGRNRQDGAVLSEHAFANAVDIAGFTFDTGPAIAVGAGGSDDPASRFLAAVRQRACTYFTTVLGPGSDPYHHDHLHLDMRVRRGDHRLCQ